MAGCLLEAVLDILFRAAVWLALLPIALVLTTPFILVRGLYGPKRYWTNVSNDYERVLAWWLNVAPRWFIA